MSTAVVDESIARIVRLLEDEQRRKSYGAITVHMQAGVVERVEIKTTKRISDLK